MECDDEAARAFLQRIRTTPPTDDLVQTSEGCYSHLIKLVDTILAEKSYPVTAIAQELQGLSNLAHKKLRLATPTALRVWRVLYTDSCILHALAILAPSTASRSIALLDKAIIIAGGGDENRLDLILSLINKIQQNLLPSQTPSRNLLNKGHQPSINPLLTACHEVPIVNSNLSFLSFQDVYSKGPFVIKGYANDWPALRENTWNSIDYLLSISGPSRVVPVEIGHDYRDDDWSQDLMNWDDFLHTIANVAHNSEDQKILYLAQHNLLRQFPSLRHDIVIPDYVYCALTPQDFPDYKPPENDEGVIINMWLGPQGATSPAHFDPYYNLYVQIVGYKTVWLSPPKTTSHMDAYCPTGRSDDPHSISACEGTNSSNTSRFDVFSREMYVEDFANFFENVVPEAMQVLLGPGDLLFFPPGWWHGMRSESTSFSVSVWF